MFNWNYAFFKLERETKNDDFFSLKMKFNEEMENSIVDFIQSTFKDAQTINLEKVGQYLKPDNLKVHVTEENS